MVYDEYIFWWLLHCNYDWECGGDAEKCLRFAIVLVTAESQQVLGNEAACMEGSSIDTSKAAVMYAHFL